MDESEENKNIEEVVYNIPKKKHNKTVIISILCVVIFLILIILSTGFAFLNINNKGIISRVKINDIEVQGLTIEQARTKLTEILLGQLEEEISLKNGEFYYSITPQQIEANYDINKAIEEAYKIGRRDNIFVNNFEIMKDIIMGKDIKIDLHYNEELLNNIAAEISTKVPEPVEETSYYIEGKNLIITKGKDGNTIDREKVKQEILNAIENEQKEILIGLVQAKPQKIDINEIYNEVYKEPKDAYYVEEPFQIFTHVDGVKFDIEQAKIALQEDKEEYTIPLTITMPEITVNKLGTKAFPNLLGSFSTNYDTGYVSRTTNLQIAVNKLDGVIVMPGEVFSYNKTLGKRTIEEGYKEAGGYEAGRIVQTIRRRNMSNFFYVI